LSLTQKGTHNSCASNCNMFAKNQHMPLINQLENGIRCFDLRCRQVLDEFHMHHGQSYLNLHYKHDVIDSFVQYLKKYPSECLIVLVSTEFRPKNNQLPFFQVFLNYITNEHRENWYLDDRLPRLGEVRGKMVLLRRFWSSCAPLGIDMSGWKDSQTFHIQNHPKFKFVIQDEYKSSYTHKWNRFV
jgi:1-phosphatidylinositol phosphodiesterase